MNKKNVIGKITDDRFYFIPAYKVFIDFAKDLAESKTSEKNFEEAD